MQSNNDGMDRSMDQNILQSEDLTKSYDQIVVTIAWIAMLIPSSLSIILWTELVHWVPFWWPFLMLIFLLILIASGFLIKRLKPLRNFMIILLIIFILGFGGGWEFGLIPVIRNLPAWISWTEQLPYALSTIFVHLLRLTPAIGVLIFLILNKRRRSDYFLVKGDINALVEPSKLIGMKKPEPWPKIGLIFAAIFTAGTFIFLIATKPPSISQFVQVIPLIPVSILIAAMNAFNEEFTLRAAPLSELWKTIGKKQGLLITTFYFGMGHYLSGVPSGIIGVALSAFLGWFLGKSLLETKGFFWAWFIHFLPDIVIFTFFAMLI
jgi:membrane protease YdiL (CAAX protease family)